MKIWFIPGTFVPLVIMKKGNINASLPDGKYFQQQPNRTHKDKSKYNRKPKHKNNDQNQNNDL